MRNVKKSPDIDIKTAIDLVCCRFYTIFAAKIVLQKQDGHIQEPYTAILDKEGLVLFGWPLGLAGNKNLFAVELTPEEHDLAKNLKERFPFAPLCIYNGRSIAPLQHHLSGNNMTYVETDRQAMESMFEYIKEQSGKEVWLMPDADMVYRYIDLEKGGIIVKPLVTEAPLQTMEGVTVPTLEKLLVDINKDPDFSYLQGAEAERMMANAKALYIINTTRLRRYAKRRGLKIEEKS